LPERGQSRSVYAELPADAGVAADSQSFAGSISKPGIVGDKAACLRSAAPPADHRAWSTSCSLPAGHYDHERKVVNAAACGPQGGWYYDNDNNPKNVLLCPATCQTIQSDPKGQIEIKFGCATIPVPT
jgi:hypothetical protein